MSWLHEMSAIMTLLLNAGTSFYCCENEQMCSGNAIKSTSFGIRFSNY